LNMCLDCQSVIKLPLSKGLFKGGLNSLVSDVKANVFITQPFHNHSSIHLSDRMPQDDLFKD
jgi:hypothetical protein